MDAVPAVERDERWKARRAGTGRRVPDICRNHATGDEGQHRWLARCQCPNTGEPRPNLANALLALREAPVLDIDLPELRGRFADKLACGAAEASLKVTQSLFRKATGGGDRGPRLGMRRRPGLAAGRAGGLSEATGPSCARALRRAPGRGRSSSRRRRGLCRWWGMRKASRTLLTEARRGVRHPPT